MGLITSYQFKSGQGHLKITLEKPEWFLIKVTKVIMKKNKSGSKLSEEERKEAVNQAFDFFCSLIKVLDKKERKKKS